MALRGERRRQVWVSLSISRYLDLKFHLQQQKPDMAAANSFTLLRCVDMLPFASVCISFRGAQCSMCSASIERTLHPFFRKSSYSAATPGQYWICPEGHHRLQYQLFPGILASFDMFFFPKKNLLFKPRIPGTYSAKPMHKISGHPLEGILQVIKVITRKASWHWASLWSQR